MPGWYGKRFVDAQAAVNLRRRGEQLLELARRIQADVLERFDVCLEIEPNVL